MCSPLAVPFPGISWGHGPQATRCNNCKHSFTSEATFKLITRCTHAPFVFLIANTEPEPPSQKLGERSFFSVGRRSSVWRGFPRARLQVHPCMYVCWQLASLIKRWNFEKMDPWHFWKTAWGPFSKKFENRDNFWNYFEKRIHFQTQFENDFFSK